MNCWTKFLTNHMLWIDHVTTEHLLASDVWSSKSLPCLRLLCGIINGIWGRSVALINVCGRCCRSVPENKAVLMLYAVDVVVAQAINLGSLTGVDISVTLWTCLVYYTSNAVRYDSIRGDFKFIYALRGYTFRWIVEHIANWFNLQQWWRTERCAVIGCKLKQNADEGCNSCASLAGLVLSFIACFILLVTAPLTALLT